MDLSKLKPGVVVIDCFDDEHVLTSEPYYSPGHRHWHVGAELILDVTSICRIKNNKFERIKGLLCE